MDISNNIMMAIFTAIVGIFQLLEGDYAVSFFLFVCCFNFAVNCVVMRE